MIWLRRTGISFVGLLLIILLLLGVILTPWGTGLALSLVSSSLDQLEIERESGGLGGQLKLRHVVWDDGVNRAELDDILLDVNWSCSLTVRACVTKLAVGKIDVKVKQSEPSEEPASTEPEKITLPIPVQVDELLLGSLNVEIDDVIGLSWKTLSLKVEMFQTLVVDNFKLVNPIITLPVSTQQQQPATSEPFSIADISQWQYTPISLPDLFIPIDAQINALEVNLLEVIQDNQQLVQIEKVSTSLIIEDSSLQLNQLAVVHQQGSLNASGKLQADYQHNFLIAAETSAAAPHNLQTDLSLKGSLQALTINGKARGDLHIDLDANVRLSDSELPIDASVSWQQIDLNTWLQDLASSMTLRSGELNLSGDLSQYELMVKGGLLAEELPETSLAIALSGNNKAVTLDSANIETLEGIIELTGKLTLTNVADWQGLMDIRDIKPASYWPEYEGLINASVEHQVVYSDTSLLVNVSDIAADGNWLGYPLMASGTAQYDSVKGVKVPRIVFSTGGNKLELVANISPDNDIEGKLELDFSDLSHLYSELTGNVLASANVAGTLAQPRVEFSSTMQEIDFQTSKIESATLSGEIIWDEDKQVSLASEIQNLDINGQLIDNLKVTLEGDASEHALVALLDSDVIKIDSEIVGQLFDGKWAGRWREGKFSSEYGVYELNNPETNLIADWLNNHYEIGAHCWLDNASELCVKQAIFKDSLANVDISGAKLETLQIASKFVPELRKISTDTRLFFDIQGQWQPDTFPTASINGYFTPTKISIEGRKQPINLTELSFSLNADETSAMSKLRLATQQTGVLELDAKITEPDGQQNLTGELNINSFLLKPFAELVPVLDELAGEIDGDLKLSGTLKVPLINGAMNVSNVTIAGDLLPARIDAWNQEVLFDGQSATFKGEFLLGNGKGKSDGSLDWSDILLAEMNLQGDNFELDYLDTIRARFSPKVSIKIEPDIIKVDGNVDVFYARVKVEELPPDAQSPSEDVVLINEEPVEKETGRPLALTLQVNIDPKKSNDVKLDAFGLTTDLQGSLTIEQVDTKLTGSGDLNLVNGRYQAYGQDLIIRKGEILFSGPLDRPTLDIEAIRDPDKTADDVIAGIKVTGQAEQPDIEVFSNPAKEQTEALSYLLQGKSFNSPTEGGGSDEAMLASVLLNAGLSGSENRVNRLGRKLGIEDLAFNAKGSGEDTQVSVTGNVAPGVQLSYEVGVFDSSSKVGLRYQLLPQLYLKAVSGAETALDIFYQFSLGRVEESE